MKDLKVARGKIKESFNHSDIQHLDLTSSKNLDRLNEAIRGKVRSYERLTQ